MGIDAAEVGLPSGLSFSPSLPRSTSGWSSSPAARAAAGRKRRAAGDGDGGGDFTAGGEGGRCARPPVRRSVTKNHRYLPFLPKFCRTSTLSFPPRWSQQDFFCLVTMDFLFCSKRSPHGSYTALSKCQQILEAKTKSYFR